MSITDELRKWASVEVPYKYGHQLTAIADRIDAEHQKALDERKAEHGQMWLKGYSECHAELLEGNEILASDLERCGWIRLPKDADGEYIHIGDVMEWIDLEGKVSVTCTAEAVGVDAFIAWDKANGRYAQKRATAYRHYYAPTVEDVLREFFSRYVTTKPKDEDDAILAEYAAKLRLAKEDA